ncbi:head completion/stabilization protein [Aeromonas caviae]|uniref:head completion/stabilization protein n=1 Tax=Aeromonas caviae TaxID=648 RepID=UPI0014330E44|nr:head completion/stabilization protein [Aeromonas caviae]NKD16208.1 head completion/stabilization protein [Aeromonas caviae]
MFAGKDIDYSAATIRNDGFWPDVAVADFERRRALPADLDQQTTGAALLAAVSEINLQLASHQATLQAKGYASAAVVPGPSLDDGADSGKNALTEQYLAAVFARAKAALLPEFASVTERATANNQVERSPDQRAQLLAESQQLVRSIKGKHRAGVSLI